MFSVSIKGRNGSLQIFIIAVLYFHEPLTVNKIVGGLLITAAGIGVSAAPLLQRSSVADPNH